jgi:hypothetical protein
VCDFTQLMSCFYAAGCFPEGTFNPDLARKAPFVFSIDDLSSVLSPQNPMRVRLWGDTEDYLYLTALVEQVSFISVDPGRQYGEEDRPSLH